jgi:hypothetical protein
MRHALIFGDESDTTSPHERDVFVYAFLCLGHSTYENLHAAFWTLKRERRVATELKWTKSHPHRAAFLALIASHPVSVRYWVAEKASFKGARPDRYRRKTLEAAFSSELMRLSFEDMPLVLLDERHVKQDREEAVVLRSLGTKWQSPIPPYAYLPSDRVVGLQLADLVVGARAPQLCRLAA